MQRQIIDLHIHTTCSDGTWTPKQILECAALGDVRVLSITDHDTVEAYQAIEQFSLNEFKIIPGIEFTVAAENELHILGYHIDLTNDRLLNYCQEIKKRRMIEITRVISKLRNSGVVIDIDELVQKYHRLNTHTVIRYLIDNCYAKNRQEVSARFLGHTGIAHVDQYRINPDECIEMISKAGGIAVLAHPFRFAKPFLQIQSLVERLKVYGLSGIECFHPDHSEQDAQNCLKIAKTLGLYISGGSDFHGNTPGAVPFKKNFLAFIESIKKEDQMQLLIGGNYETRRN